MKTPIIFTDLDGTLLDFVDYSWNVAKPVVAEATRKGIPVIFCSSKTRAEQEVYRKALDLNTPFIVENGSAIFIPKGYFSFPTGAKEGKEGYEVLELGHPASFIREAIVAARRATGTEVFGYQDLSLAEIASIIHLDEAAAKRAATRDYSETLLKGDKSSAQFHELVGLLEKDGLTCVSGGKFHTVMGKDSNKGKAVRTLAPLLEKKFGSISTIGLGDSANDLPLLKATDRPFLVQKPGNIWQEVADPKITKVEAVGPQGWVKVVADLLKNS